ncbi:hypothetical protein [Billgrantia gudaonensis]|uniref:Uncharacterized protein n=1 Tax=Billgrantia gudaonensis TaxID=376427 RepID=A0A1G8QYQ8_9GAMM|nr:hypothetical protein [Halomonas gudaonensis]SDJ09817.1 hypothetical protein SAMN04487954_10333 [Halomonas gudaonensis]
MLVRTVLRDNTFQRNITIRGLASWIFVSLIILNNLVYQTNLQLNQVLVIISAVLLAFLVALSRGTVSKYVVTFTVIVFLIYIPPVFFRETSQAVNRSFAYFLILMLYIFLLFYGYKVDVRKTHFFVFFAFYLAILSYVILSGDRLIINPNWISLTLFYLFFLAWGKTSFIFLIFGLLSSFFVFESRGVSIVFFVAMLLFLAQKTIGEKSTKIIYISIYFSLVVFMFYIIHLLSIDDKSLLQIIISITERGLGGRETALIQGYQDLIESNLLGIGPASPGGYDDPVTGQGVHIHFGLLELMLKYTGLVLLGFCYLIIRLVKSASSDQFPMVGGAMMVVFFYNGLAPSHLGLNVLLLMIISKVILTSGNHINGLFANNKR